MNRQHRLDQLCSRSRLIMKDLLELSRETPTLGYVGSAIQHWENLDRCLEGMQRIQNSAFRRRL